MDRPHLTIGATLDLLKAAKYTPDANVYYDFGSLVPYRGASYRGFYEHFALGFGVADPTSDYEKRTVLRTPEELIAELEQAIGRTYTGWKGGEFTMHRDTLLWVAQTGEAPGTGVCGVRLLGRDETYTAIIETRYVDPDEVPFDAYRIVRMIGSAMRAPYF